MPSGASEGKAPGRLSCVNASAQQDSIPMTFFAKSPMTRPRGFASRTVPAFLVAFYVLASVRALVPGLCATQAAMNQEAACCAHGSTESGQGQPILHVPAAAHPSCAFCSLAQAMATPGAALPAISLSGLARAIDRLEAPAPQVHLDWSPASRRGPPATAPSC